MVAAHRDTRMIEFQNVSKSFWTGQTRKVYQFTATPIATGGFGRLSSITDRNANQMTFAYGAAPDSRQSHTLPALSFWQSLSA